MNVLNWVRPNEATAGVIENAPDTSRSVGRDARTVYTSAGLFGGASRSRAKDSTLKTWGIGQGMKKSALIQLLLAALLTGVSASVPAAGDAAAGEIKAIPCLGCHGIPGYFNVYPTYHVPRVGGQHAQYIVDALSAYKSGARDHSTMSAQAASLSEQDMADIAAYFEAATRE